MKKENDMEPEKSDDKFRPPTEEPENVEVYTPKDSPTIAKDSLIAKDPSQVILEAEEKVNDAPRPKKFPKPKALPKVKAEKNSKPKPKPKRKKRKRQVKKKVAKKTLKKSKPKPSKKTKKAKQKPKVKKTTTKSKPKKVNSRKTLEIANERDIALDFATKAYKEFDTLIKSVVLFGSAAKHETTANSDIDIIIVIDDVSIRFDEELISWYRNHLGRLLKQNKYIRPLHVNSVKLSTWWQDLMRGDPVVVNVLRYGEALIDFGGFFNPLKIMLKEGRIRSTPEAIYTLLERAPTHIARARKATLATVDGLYWSMVDSAHAALIAADIMPPSPEKVPEFLRENFVKNKLLNKKYVDWYIEAHNVAKDIVHGKRTEVSGKLLDDMFIKSDDFLREMAKLVDEIIREKE